MKASPLALRRLRELPRTFTSAQAHGAGRLTSRQLAALREDGLVEPLGRGLYRRTEPAVNEPGVQLPDLDLIEIAHRAEAATLCLTSALARHGLIDVIPATIDVALPRGAHRPAVALPVSWHSFDRATFAVGRELLEIDADTAIGIYGEERCIVDAFRLSHLEGEDLALDALKQWLRRPGSVPSSLLRMARSFPTAQPSLRRALTILL